MKFALDFDDTYTATPDLWGPWIAHAKRLGHSVTFVTFRSKSGNNSDILQESILNDIEIVYSEGRQKRHVFPDADVWIDDMPEVIPSYGQLRNMSLGCEFMKDFGT
jgi:hypothetical protein